MRCIRCGRARSKTPHSFEMVQRECRAWPHWHEFGEWLAIFFGVFFVTPAVVTYVYRKLGLIEVSESCNCEARKEWLNTLGGKLCSSPRWQWLAAWVVRRR